jgi:hypothetical protein
MKKKPAKKNLVLEVRQIRQPVPVDTMCTELTTTSDTVQQR